MESEGVLTLYEEVRKRNVERNQEVMRMLGLIPQSCEEKQEAKAARRQRTAMLLENQNSKRRRSARVAAFPKTTSQWEETTASDSLVQGSMSTSNKLEGRDDVFIGNNEPSPTYSAEEIQETKKEMEPYNDFEDTYSTDSSTEAWYGVEVNVDLDGRKSTNDKEVETNTPAHNFGNASSALNSNSANEQVATAFGTEFQDLVFRAVMQSTAALIGPPPALSSLLPNGSTGSLPLSIQGVQSTKIWNEEAYNIAEANRKRKILMTRTSAGEESDSQEEFSIPENETPQQRSLRTRRLNRSRAKRAKDLTNNRKALKKLPYVIFVDGMAKAKGIHKHLWRAAVRGQCGRLDPTMDNINHHPKQVVDSVWHALEKEWEFEGFAHRAREMFEKSATKFMRNRKMQLKYKCLKNVDGRKPDDVSASHWTKIVDLTKKSMKQASSNSYMQTTPKGKEQVSLAKKENNDWALPQLVIEHRTKSVSPSGSPKRRLERSDSFLLSESDVDARIRRLQSELLKLQNSRETGFNILDRGDSSGPNTMAEGAIVNVMNKVIDDMKENIIPRYGNGDQLPQASAETTRARRFGDVQGKQLRPVQGHNLSPLLHGMRELQGAESSDNINETEMDCGDVIRVFAFMGGRKEEIGKGIVMGLAGSKYARKVIPNGWRSIKVTSYTSNGASKICPFPAGWTEQLKNQTVKEASGRTILWPDMLLHSLVYV